MLRRLLALASITALMIVSVAAQTRRLDRTRGSQPERYGS